MANAVGRPLIKLSDLSPEWQKIVIDEFAVGASLQEIYGYLDISESTFKRLCRDEPEFSRTIKRGLRLSQKWWLEVGRKYIRDKDFNATLWYMNMKNRFDWADKKEIKQDITSNGETVSQPVDANLLTNFLMQVQDNTKR